MLRLVAVILRWKNCDYKWGQVATRFPLRGDESGAQAKRVDKSAVLTQVLPAFSTWFYAKQNGAKISGQAGAFPRFPLALL